eukprot:TRINITY_DN708_c0_g1_i5.p1 TRINITY_DN708_c0_g1~~TRINITY_DN708_c0_g1_i5.p1  ORF type:complete len:655 (-),score=140.32 TRINITY_DN708_c0_g1_i5:136-2076(-)
MQMQACPSFSRRVNVLPFKKAQVSTIVKQLQQQKSKPAQICCALNVSRFLADLQSQVNVGAVQSQLTNVVKDVPQETLLIGGGVGVVLLLLAAVAVAASQKSDDSSGEVKQAKPAAKSGSASKIVKEDCVLVFGNRGNLEIIKQLLSEGQNVAAALRSEEDGKGLQGEVKGLKGKLYLESGVDITKPETLTETLFQGVKQIVIAPEVLEDSLPMNINYKGVQNIIAAAKTYMKGVSQKEGMLTTISVEKWEPIDDVIMGGQSSSQIEALESGTIKFSGNVITEGGGFCGTRIRGLDNIDVSEFDGLSFRVKADGSTFKMNIKTDAFEEGRSDTYQAVFDTVKDAWTEVKLPWWQFRFVSLDGKYRKDVYNKQPLNPKQSGEKIVAVSLLYSRFNYNRLANPNFKAGQFQAEFDTQIKLFQNQVPQVVLVTSAAVERNAIIGDDQQLREQQIPIVKLNPNKVLDWMYAGEGVVRDSGLSYTIVRPTQLKSDEEYLQEDALLDIQQGDYISGRLGLPQLAYVVAAAAKEPLAIGKTFEVTKNEQNYATGKSMSMASFRRAFKGLAADWERPKFDLPALPAVVIPGEAAPLLEEKNAVQEAEQWVAAWMEAKNSAAPVSAPAASSNGYIPNVKEAVDWVQAWRKTRSMA